MNQQGFGNQKLQLFFAPTRPQKMFFKKNESLKLGILEKFKRSRVRTPTRHGAKISGRKGSNA